MRSQVIAGIADAVPRRPGRVRVGVDGPDGSGKTVLADELAEELRSRGRDVVRASADDFHQVRALRHARGRDDPEGMWLDSYDYGRLRRDVLDPLGPGGDGRASLRAHDLATDAVLEPAWEQAPAGAVLVLDGLFLHRDELAGCFELTLWLEVPFEVTCARMAVRDGTDPDPAHPSVARYVGAQRIYQDLVRPASRADVVVDNSVLDRPVLRRSGQPLV